MKKLSIQLSRHGHATTRRPRWVVWLLGGVLIFLGLLHLTSLWFTRSELLIAAPTNTEVAIEINISARNVEKIASLFTNIPVISNRSIELSDVLPYTGGKFALFILSDGTSAIALKAKKHTLPTNLLDIQQIVVQEASPNVVLLSEKLLSLSPLKKPSVKGRWLPNLLGTTIGTVYMPEKKTAGLLSLGDSMLSFKLKNVSFPTLKRKLPKETFAYMSTLVMTNTVMNTFIDRFENTKQLKDIFSADSWIFLTKSELNQGFIIWSETPTSFDRNAFIKQISANLSPRVQEKRLVDGSIVQELSIDPDLGSIEELTILGRTFFHSRSQNGEEFYLSTNNDLVFSNNEDNLRSFLEGNGQSSDQICGGNAIAVLFAPIIDAERNVSNYYVPSFLRELASKFQSIGLKSNGKSSKINLCL